MYLIVTYVYIRSDILYRKNGILITRVLPEYREISWHFVSFVYRANREYYGRRPIAAVGLFKFCVDEIIESLTYIIIWKSSYPYANSIPLTFINVFPPLRAIKYSGYEKSPKNIEKKILTAATTTTRLRGNRRFWRRRKIRDGDCRGDFNAGS